VRYQCWAKGGKKRRAAQISIKRCECARSTNGAHALEPSYEVDCQAAPAAEAGQARVEQEDIHGARRLPGDRAGPDDLG
jgi:hypothetical protein